MLRMIYILSKQPIFQKVLWCKTQILQKTVSKQNNGYRICINGNRIFREIHRKINTNPHFRANEDLPRPQAIFLKWYRK